MMKESISVFALMPGDALSHVYEQCCEEYRRRLCGAWDIRFEESWWSQERIGGQLFIADWWKPLDMEELRFCVDNNVAEKSWLEYCDFVEAEAHDGRQYPRINFYSWFALNCRPKDLNNGETDSVE